MEYQPDADTDSLIRSILSTHLPGRPIDSIRFVGNGWVNAVYAASIGGEEFVLRLADARYRAGEHEKEAWCFERARAAGIPGPKVLAVGTRDRTAYMVQEFVHGLPGDDASIDPSPVWNALGRYTRLIHAIDTSDFTFHYHRDDRTAEQTWARYVAYGLASLTPDDALITLGVYALEQQWAIRDVFERLQRQSFQFGLNHGDLSARNTIVSATGQINLIDWGCASVGIVPHVDIVAILRWLHPDDVCFSAFLAGYGLSPAGFASILPQIEDFRLLNTFDLVRWAIDRRPDQIEQYAAGARQTWANYQDVVWDVE